MLPNLKVSGDAFAVTWGPVGDASAFAAMRHLLQDLREREGVGTFTPSLFLMLTVPQRAPTLLPMYKKKVIGIVRPGQTAELC